MSFEIRPWLAAGEGEPVLSPGRVGYSGRRPRVLRAAILLLAAPVGLVWFAGSEPPRRAARPALIAGEVGQPILACAFSPDGTTVATADGPSRVALRSLERGRILDRLPPFPGRAWTVAFAPDGRALAGGGEASGLVLWEMEPGAARVVPLPIDRILRVAFAPDGRSLAATTNRDGTVVIWDLGAGRVQRVLLEDAPVHDIAFSPDGLTFASAQPHRPGISLWDLGTGRRRLRLGDDRSLSLAIAFAPDGEHVAEVSAHHQARLWELGPVESGRVIWEQRGINAVAFAPDGGLLAVATTDGMVRLCEAATGRQRELLEVRGGFLNRLVFSADGRRLAGYIQGSEYIQAWELGGASGTHDHPAPAASGTRRERAGPAGHLASGPRASAGPAPRMDAREKPLP